MGRAKLKSPRTILLSSKFSAEEVERLKQAAGGGQEQSTSAILRKMALLGCENQEVCLAHTVSLMKRFEAADISKVAESVARIEEKLVGGGQAPAQADMLSEFKKLAGWIKKTIEEGKAQNANIADDVARILRIAIRDYLVSLKKISNDLGKNGARDIDQAATLLVKDVLDTAKVPYEKL